MPSELPAIARNLMGRSAGLYVRAFVAASIAVAAFFALSYAASFVDRQGIAAKLKAANARGELAQTWAGWSGRAIPRFHGNDCLMLGALLQDYPGRLAETLSARIPPADAQPPPRAGDPTIPACLQLIAALEWPDPADPNAIFYHRYLHGQRVFAALALAVVSPAALGWITLLANALLLLSVLVPALRRRNEGWREHGYAAIAATLLLFDGLWLFGIYFSFSISDLVLAAFVACAYHAGIARGDERRFVTAVALFGVATAIFEFLTGGIPFGLALLLGLVALDGPADRDALLWRAFHGSLIFALAIALTFAIKLVLVMLFVDPNVLADFRSALSTRVGASFIDSLPPQEVAWLAAHGIDVASLDRHWIFALLYMLARLAYATFVIGFGSPVLGMIIMGAAVIASAALLIRRWRNAPRGVARTRLLILLGSALVMPAWSLVFVNHTLLHAVWMVRPFAWFIALAGLLLWWPAEDRAAAQNPGR
ncbi:MAG: hypothetical protein WDO17_11605 [Alphaproteobacteria bacterium]